MFRLEVKCIDERIEIEVWFGRERIARHELPARDMRDRAAIESAFSGAESIFRKEVLEFIQSRTQIL